MHHMKTTRFAAFAGWLPAAFASRPAPARDRAGQDATVLRRDALDVNYRPPRP